MTTLGELERKRPPKSPEEVSRVEGMLLREIQAYRLRELREREGFTQVVLAERLSITQNRVSRIEHGDLDRTKIDTLRRYVSALGGTLHLDAQFGDEIVRIA